MITGIAFKHKDEYQEDSWQRSMATAIRDPFELLARLNLSQDKFKKQLYLTNKFKLLVPLSYVGKMQKGNWDDPLLKQVLPVMDEGEEVAGFKVDPVGDLKAEISAGVLQKYQGRVLLVTTGACAVHCRYCFRRHFPYVDSLADNKNWSETLANIKADSSLSEVILSGGDPLMLSDEKLQAMCAELADIPHIKTLRFHSRVPVFIPQRINAAFLSWTKQLPVKKVMVIHANHANELDDEVGRRLNALGAAGFTLLNQTVLLKGVNDSADALVGLSQKLFSMNVLPYYLHQLDQVQGAAHFGVDRAVGMGLIENLKKTLPGYLVPRYVEEISGERCKQAIVKID